MGVEWRFEVAEENLRVLVAALHCLAQVGKELSLEAECAPPGGPTGGPRLTLRALNDAHSASAQVALERSFFSASGGGADGSMGALRTALGGRSPFVKCKVYAKACCNVFRTLKHVRSAQLAFLLDEMSAVPADGAADHDRDGRDGDGPDAEVDVDCVEIRWRLACDFDITKTHRIKVHACQIMDAVFDKRSCPSRWSTRQHHLSSLLAHIHHTNEVLVVCSPTHVKFESYFPNAGDGKSQLHTETAVEAAEFNEYVLSPAQHSADASVQLVFSIKEVKSLLAFCKSSDILEIKFYYSNDGSPVLFAAESTAMAKCSIEITLSTVTTFLPALSQSQSANEDTIGVRPAFQLQDDGSEQLADQRYLTRTTPEDNA